MIPLEPDAARAVVADVRMRARLADSLDYIFEQSEGRLALPPPEARAGFLSRLAAEPVPPLAFAGYCDAVLAISAGENDRAEALLAEIVAMPAQHRLSIDVLGDPADDPVAERIERMIDTDPARSFSLVAPTAEMADACGALVARAMDMIERGDPALAAEFHALVRQIILVDTVGEGAAELAGASSFMLWGAVLLNARVHTDLIELVAALAHESGHNLLFGLAADGPLVLNEDFERFTSPLRSDLRPMDGIIHAVYVVARVHRSLSVLLRSGVFSAKEAERVRAGLTQQADVYRRGLKTVRAEARLTPLGQKVMAGVEAYMDGVLEPA